MNIIVLDPGHGSGPRQDWQGRGYDSGACYKDRTEAEAALEAAFTLKALLVEAGFKVYLTHDGNDGPKVDLNTRIREAVKHGASAFISLHYDQAFPKPRHHSGVYYAPGQASQRFAEHLRPHLRQGEDSWIAPSSSSRFDGLYIDAFPDQRPSVLLELDSIQYAPAPAAAGRQDRLNMLTPIAAAISTYFIVRPQ